MIGTEAEIEMEPVACDCCGGYFDDCENCRAGRRVVEWVDGAVRCDGGA
jgi:hypothetical protein